MSLQLDNPRRVALQQSSPPLHQPGAILREERKFEKENPWNGKCANSGLSQQRGSPQNYVPIVRKVLSGKKAATFFQLDRRISMMIDVQLTSRLPLVESQE